MMNKLLYFATLLLFVTSCKKERKEYTFEEQRRIDSIADQLMANSQRRIFEEGKTTDTVGVSKAPIKIVSAQIVESNTGRYRNVRLKYKNVSPNKITAIKFRWRGENAFLEPADMGSSFLEGYGGGWTDDPLAPSASNSATWEILSEDAKTIEAWPIEAVFDNGTKWKLKDD